MSADEALTGLLERLAVANTALLDTVGQHWEVAERYRIQGKAEGVRLAISYVNDAIRQEAQR